MSDPMPPGYRRLDTPHPYENFLAPIFVAECAAGQRYAMRVAPSHANVLGITHGGVLMGFAASTLRKAAESFAPESLLTLLNHQTEFLRPARLGDLIEVTPELTHRSRTMLWVSGTYGVGDIAVMRVRGLFGLTPPQSAAGER